MQTLNPGDIVIAFMQFLDGAGQKKRPALVVSNRDHNQATHNIVLAYISSKGVKNDYDIPIIDWGQSGLRMPSIVRTGRLVTINSEFAKKIGALNPNEFARVKDRVLTILS